MRPPTILPRCRDARASGFTLVEILIVVIILGILAAIVLPAFSNQTTEAEKATFCSNLRQYADAIMFYHEKHGSYPADGMPADAPPGTAQCLDASRWASARPLGGKWDWDYNVFGVTAGISVYKPARTDAQMAEIDRLIDDGDLATGKFRKRSDGFIYILEP